MRWDNNRPPPTIKDFDNKVSEADAYLQLMIEQTKVSNTLDLIILHSNIAYDQYGIILCDFMVHLAHFYDDWEVMLRYYMFWLYLWFMYEIRL